MSPQIIRNLKAEPRYVKNVMHGKPRKGHPEGTVAAHILELEENLDSLKSRLTEDEYWKLLFLIHLHDTFKAEATPDSPILSPNSHASLAKEFAKKFTDDEDLLNMIQYHDENFALWRQYDSKGQFNQGRFELLLKTIKNWRLFLVFLIIDGCTRGKGNDKMFWFLHLVKERMEVDVDDSWVIEH